MARIIRRTVWGARPPRSTSFIRTPTSKLWLHHFGTNGWTGPAGMRACQNFHMDDPDRRYWDIAYTAMADAGAVYEGRGIGVAGAHTSGWNTNSHAVAAAIDGTDYVPDGVVDRLAEAAVWLWREGAVDEPAYDGGHRDVGDTVCPGDQLYALIPEINRRAARLAQGDVVSYEQAVVVPDDRWDKALGTAIAAWHTLALVESDGKGRLTSDGKEARVGEPILIGAAQQLDLPNSHVVAGGDAEATAFAVARFLAEHPDRRRPGRPLNI